MHLQRDWVLPNGETCTDHPVLERDCGCSIQWMCCYCGQSYAKMDAFKDGKLQVYNFRGACCPACSHRAHRYILAGSLECIMLIGWAVPKPVVDWQFSIELAFTEHSDHPHNKVYYS